MALVTRRSASIRFGCTGSGSGSGTGTGTGTGTEIDSLAKDRRTPPKLPGGTAWLLDDRPVQWRVVRCSKEMYPARVTADRRADLQPRSGRAWPAGPHCEPAGPLFKAGGRWR